MRVLEKSLRAKRDAGRKLLAIYITAGVRDDWVDLIRAAIDGGADVIEVGIPFSDPVMDGPIIQLSSVRALERGTTPIGVFDAIRGVNFATPLVAMTYYNPVLHMGEHAFAQMLSGAGISGAIIPDLPFDEAQSWIDAARANEISTIFLASPITDDARLCEIAAHATGFIYAIGRLGVTGEQVSLATSATEIGGRVRGVTDLPALVGIGVTTAEQAASVCAAADGVIVGSAVMRLINDGASCEDVTGFVRSLRHAMDAVL